MDKMMAALPREIKEILGERQCKVEDIGKSGSAVLMFPDMVLKIQKMTSETESEYRILEWLNGKLPVPKLLCRVTEHDMCYVLMSRMKGDMACNDYYLQHPKVLIECLAEGLKRLWEVDITDCPCNWELDAMLEAVTENVRNGLVDVEDTEPETFGEGGFRDPEDLLEWLKKHRPKEEPVLSHGDFCLPNIFLEHDRLAGYIDLGRTGTADKWKDIAICYRSLKHNLSGKYAKVIYEDVDPDMLFEALGVEPDWEKIRYYILLDELM